LFLIDDAAGLRERMTEIGAARIGTCRHGRSSILRTVSVEVLIVSPHELSS
jgi:hypothetical protein